MFGSFSKCAIGLMLTPESVAYPATWRSFTWSTLKFDLEGKCKITSAQKITQKEIED